MVLILSRRWIMESLSSLGTGIILQHWCIGLLQRKAPCMPTQRDSRSLLPRRMRQVPQLSSSVVTCESCQRDCNLIGSLSVLRHAKKTQNLSTNRCREA